MARVDHTVAFDREIFIDVEPDVRIRHRRSTSPPYRYELAVEQLRDDEWATMQLWGSAGANGSASTAMIGAMLKARRQCPTLGRRREEAAARTRSGPEIDTVTVKILAGIRDPELADRYPDRAHFISAEHPSQDEMATRTLVAGDPVVLTYEDGRELLVTLEPDERGGANPVSTLRVRAATLLRRLRGEDGGEDAARPQRTRVEARDPAGQPLAA